jgi:hypothetical protein
MYDGLKAEAELSKEDEYIEQLNKSKEKMEEYFLKVYVGSNSSATPNAPQTVTAKTNTSKRSLGLSANKHSIDFTARYHQRTRLQPSDELEEFFRMRGVPCNHQAQFPNLSRFARDIFSMPGMS